jgi:hypothetical protein
MRSIDLLKNMTGEYKTEVIATRKLLMGYIQGQPPQLRVLDGQFSGKPGPGEIESQIADLRDLLNDVERENHLEESCRDLKLPVLPESVERRINGSRPPQ